MKTKRATQLLALMRQIDREFARYYQAGNRGRAVAGQIVESLDLLFGELRDTLWHEVPRAHALEMDREDDLPAGRGQYP